MATISNQGGTVDALVDELARALDSKRIIKSYLPDSLSEEFARNSIDSVVREAFSLSFPKVITHEYGYKGYSPRAEKMWIIEREYYESQGKSESLQMVTIRLLPGVSLREARKAAASAVASFPKKPMMGRPRVAEWDRKLMRELFSICDEALSRRGIRKQVAGLARAILQKLGHPISSAKVGSELRKFLREKGYHVKHYSRS